MKKFSTAALLLALASVSYSSGTIAAEDNAPATNAARCNFLPNAPDQHLVVKGDTLWGIAGRFLEHPWCWPQVWGMNRDEIRNPHWIYPGQIVYFDRVAGRLRLGRVTGSGSASATPSGTIRLSPQVRSQSLSSDQAISAIPARLIEPFLTRPLVIGKDEMKDSPRIVAAQEGRVNIGNSDKAYVMGDLDNSKMFQAFRPGKELKDPVSKEVIGYEAVYLGILELLRDGTEANEAHSFTVVSSVEEMGVGDRLVPLPPTPILNYVPHLPTRPVDARIVSIYGGVAYAGQNQVVSINRGADDGLDLGTVLELSHAGKTIKDRTDGKKSVKLPDEHYGTLFIFRTFDNISYGLVMQVTDPVQVGDIVKSRE